MKKLAVLALTAAALCSCEGVNLETLSAAANSINNTATNVQTAVDNVNATVDSVRAARDGIQGYSNYGY